MRPTHTPRSSRLAGAAGALLLEGGFLFLFLASMPALRPPREIGRELSLILPSRRTLPSPAPQQREAAPGPVTVTPPLFLVPNMPSNALTRPILPAAPGIGTFGQALNGCAPEKYNSLTPDQRARCPRPGAGVAIQEFPNLMRTPSHVENEAFWQEQWDEAHWTLGPCGPDKGSVLQCLMDQGRAELNRRKDARYQIAKAKAVEREEPKRPLAKGTGVHEERAEGGAGMEALGLPAP